MEEAEMLRFILSRIEASLILSFCKETNIYWCSEFQVTRLHDHHGREHWQQVGMMLEQ